MMNDFLGRVKEIELRNVNNIKSQICLKTILRLL